ncbi:DUF3828 domain-containing protein [Acinetobacter wuhouensis]|uniref:DUF3828 domain-containing protein n=1 Tax=Acinetobacter wuhouensis TaxID=1879050 RepID=A0A3G2T221_9GAMM|nr:DUF3828 domain-containing protein [Acinetobacter wuhouensis]AYO54238.1 DUF3828 domain-containing protein [Acinetobacter wuhouensis]
MIYHSKNTFKKIFLTTTILFSSSISFAEQCLSPQKLTEQMYKKHFSGRNDDVKPLASTSIQNLEKYLTKPLAKKIDNDNKCQTKTQMLCNLEFDILTDAQDSPEKPRYNITQISNTQVNVMISGVDYKKKITLKFAQENGCSKISDILYPTHQSLNHLLK